MDAAELSNLLKDEVLFDVASFPYLYPGEPIPAYIDSKIARGFTGHEHLDKTGLIHMNGRVYDPELGRFLSPDPIVQAPTNSQSWNRYSYTFNNPLNMIDPSGYSGCIPDGQPTFSGNPVPCCSGAKVTATDGRIYDPKIARFLQADPFIQDSMNTQSLNRYSYVWNNPLNATDPSGYFVFSLIAIALTATETVVTFWAIVGTFAAAGFADALLQGASFGDALKSGFISGLSAAAFAGIGDYLNTSFAGDFAAGLSEAGFALKVGLHGAVGGITSVLQGGEFGHGFAAAGFTALASSFNNSKFIGGKGFSTTRVAIGAVIGGTASKLSGGKFVNGAITGAFSQALNNEMTEEEKEAQRQKMEADRLAAAIKKIKAAHTKNQGKPCIVCMRDSLRELVGGDVGKGISNINYDSLVEQLSGKGLIESGETFTFNGSRHTPLGSVKALTTSIADTIDPGIYVVGIADGTHTMTLTYDGSTYSLLDQGTSWGGDFTSGKALDAHLLKTTQDMLPFGRADFKSILRVNKIVH